MRKIAIICLSGLDNFLDWADRLKPEYEVRKFLVNNSHDIFEALNWGEIIWLEWANESAIEALKIFENMNHPVKLNKKIVCRLHSYEALSGYVPQLKTEWIDRMVFVSEYLREFVNPACNSVVIPNGVDIDSIPFLDPNPGFDIAVVGGISHKKNPAMVLQILCKLDSRFKIHWAGAFQEPRYEVYLKHMVREMGLTDNVIFYGHVSDMNEFWKGKNYLLSTSVWEAHNYSIMEAMARGIQPVIHNFPGADRLYIEEWLFNETGRAVLMFEKIEKYRDNMGLRNYVIENGWTLEYQVNKIKEMLNNV